MIRGSQASALRIRPTALGRLHPAVRLGGVLLAVATSLALPGPGLPLLAILLLWLLARTGWGGGALLAASRPWLPAMALILVVHVLTHTAAAPLGRPSWAGLAAGCLALVRVGCTLACLGLYQRLSTLDDLVLGIGWWLAPGRRLGLPVEDLGLVLAVALGTVPVALEEGRRIETSLRLRQGGPRGARATGKPQRPGWPRRLLSKLRLLVPLLESLGRRADNLTLTLRSRRPGAGQPLVRPPAAQLLGLAVWCGGLVAWFWWGGKGP